MLSIARKLLQKRYTVKIFTARAYGTGAHTSIALIQKYCLKHLGQVLEVTATKDFDCIGILDDRAWHVVPNTGEVQGEAPDFLR